jgi:RNA-directed DNA polymerase
MVTVEDVAQFAGASVDVLGVIADRLPKEVDYITQTHRVRRGGTREIVASASALDTVTKNLYRSFSVELPYRHPDHVHGFVRGRSTLSNAAKHLNKECVLRVDLEEFFPSISAARIVRSLRAQGLDDDAADLCVRVVAIKDKLPIGLSTSPYLSNLVFEQTDARLVDYSRCRGIEFTRYVDDLIFSGEVRDRDLSEISEILEGEGWTVNRRKVAFMRRGGPQYVTGLYVGCPDRPRIPRRIKSRCAGSLT